MSMKKITAILLLLIFAAVAASCSLFRPPVSSENESASGSGGDGPVETSQPADLLREAQERIDAYRELDFTGKTVNVVCPYDSVDIYQPSDTGSSLASARVLRNMNVAGAVGVEFRVMYTRGDMAQEIRATSESGDFYADFVALPQNRVGIMAKEGFLQNLVGLPYAAVRSGSYNNTAYSASSPVYGVYGDFNFDPSYYNCVYINESLCRGHGIDAYSLYSEGKWTVGEFLKILRELDGSLENKYGFVWMSAELGSENRVTDLVYAAFGLKYMKPDGDAFADVLSPAAEDAASAAREMISLRRLSVTDLIYDGDAFLRGDVCFYSDSLGYSLSIPSSVEWGVLPMPSADGGSAKTLLPATSGMLCMLKSAPTEACGAFLGAFSSFSDGYITAMFLRDVFSSSARTSAELSAIRDVMASGVCDHAFIMAPAYKFAAAASYGAVRSAVKSGRTIAEITDGVVGPAGRELGR